jgi:hypothetical protein
MPEADPSDTPLHVSAEEYNASRGGIAPSPEVIQPVPLPTFTDSAQEQQIRMPVDRDPDARPSDDPV